MRTESCGATDTGKKRSNNEDAFLVGDQLGLYAVADGIGGHEGGERASRLAVETVRAAVPDLLGDRDSTPPAGRARTADPETFALRQAFALANRGIRQGQTADPLLSNMGTTLTALLLSRDRAFLGHIGDSRAYLLRSGALEQLTRDHSVVAEQVRAGTLRPEQVRTSPYRHIITRALGIADEADPEFTVHEIRRNDTLLLCSDGLTEMVDDQAIGRLLAGGPPRECAGKLIKAANERGGVDNITVVVVRVVG
jgi:protein phosphatase